MVTEVELEKAKDVVRADLGRLNEIEPGSVTAPSPMSWESWMRCRTWPLLLKRCWICNTMIP
ncbi:MAG: hypothetical protein JKP98_19225 [Rhodobacteraceae bacterium]|nr:hypothetical protein [Paracoccaceae bacterium]